ncbi:DUF596 domain-containing protein [Lelliottia amnigena]|uniref:DUF596 domain-containing protein n=1 Tax=Lelliottia amnigena TaxID=61646 RepID=A0ABU7UBG0_LELAM
MENLNVLYSSVIKSSYGLSMGAMWQHVRIDCTAYSDDRLFRKKIFFDILTQVLKKKVIKLAKNGIFLTGTLSEQLALVHHSWPPYSSEDEDDDLDEFGLWFLVKAPAGIVWLTSDGQEIWT